MSCPALRGSVIPLLRVPFITEVRTVSINARLSATSASVGWRPWEHANLWGFCVKKTRERHAVREMKEDPSGDRPEIWGIMPPWQRPGRHWRFGQIDAQTRHRAFRC